jgi:hypothetical protein
MREINAVRSEIQSKFDNDMKQFKKDITDRLESEIAMAVKNSVAIALEGISAMMNQILSANNTIVYDNKKSEREIIMNATAVAKKVDIAVTAAVSRALAVHAQSSAASPARKKDLPTKMTLSWKTATVKSSCHADPRSINLIVDGTPSNVPPRASQSSTTRRHFPATTKPANHIRPHRSTPNSSDPSPARDTHPPIRPVRSLHSVVIRPPVRRSRIWRCSQKH